MSSSSEEELDEFLRRQIIGQPRNFEERPLFDIENSREFRLPVHSNFQGVVLTPKMELKF